MCVCVCVFVCVHVRVRKNVFMCMHACMYVCMLYVCMHACMYVRMHTYLHEVHTHTHTHTHTHVPVHPERGSRSLEIEQFEDQQKGFSGRGGAVANACGLLLTLRHARNRQKKKKEATWQKSPMYTAKEPYAYVKRGLCIRQKSPIYMVHEAYV